MSTKILFAGGGTAGHVEPALAVATWLKNAKPNWDLTFVGTKNGLENQLVPKAGFELRHIPKVLMPRQFTPATLIWPVKIVFATLKAIKVCRDTDLVIGFGGMPVRRFIWLQHYCENLYLYMKPMRFLVGQTD